MFYPLIVLAPCAAVCKRRKRAKYAVCTHVLHTSYPSQIFLQKNAKWGLTFEDCIAIIAHAVRRCATEYVERWLSWSKAHDWKYCSPSFEIVKLVNSQFLTTRRWKLAVFYVFLNKLFFGNRAFSIWNFAAKSWLSSQIKSWLPLQKNRLPL